MPSSSSGSGHLAVTDDHRKRWLVVGIALNTILIPQIRSPVEKEIEKEYNNLKTNHNIHGQSTSCRLQRWPPGTVLKYENVNGNDVHPRLSGGRLNYSLFDCRVTSHVDFARLYVANHMAKFSAFDDHCDASAVLSLLSRVPVFSTAIQAAADKVRVARNDWAHCVFSKWDVAKFHQTFVEMEQLVKELKLPAADDGKLRTELKDWESRGTHICMNSPVDPVLLQLLQQKFSSLQDDVNKMSEGCRVEKNKVQVALHKVASDIEDWKQRVEELESGQQNTARQAELTESRVDDLEDRIGVVEAKLEEVPTSLREPHLPEEGKHFIGRKAECEEIINNLTSVSAGIVGIYGPPGFGKSQVAIAVGNELKRQEKSVYHFELSKIRTCDELLSKFLYYIHLSPHDSFFTQHLKPIDLFCRTIENVSDNLYFILDDMDNLLQPNVRDDVAGLLKEILTKCLKMTFIVTSRESLTLHSEFFHPEVFRVGSLNKIHSQELVKKLIPKATDCESKKISDLCENMPFAILLLCKSILESDRLLNSAITDFKRSIESSLESLHKPVDVRNSRLMGIFESSFQRLTLQSDKDAIVALSTIPQSFDENLAAAVLGLDESKTSNVLERLHRRSLLEENCGLFKMNKLLASFARAKGKLKEMNALFLEAKTRFCNHNISLLGKLSDDFLSGNAESKSAAHEIFHNEKQNIVSSLTDGCSLNDNTRKQAFDVLSKVELFLDTLLWRDSATFNKIYDQAMAEAEECGDRVAFNRMVVAKAFSEVTWNSTEAKTMQLLPSLLKETQLSNISDVERGKCACYFGIYRLVNGNIEGGIELLEFSLSKWKGTTDLLLKILEVLSSQILSLIYESTNDIKRAVDFYQNAEEQCKNVGGRSLLFVPEIMAEYKSTSQEKMRKDDNHSRSQPLESMIYLIIVKATKTFVSTSKIEQFQTNIHRLLEQESVEDTSSGYKTSMMYFHQFVVEILAHMGNCQEAKKIVQIEIARMEEVQKRILDQDSSHPEYKDVTEALAKSYSILAVYQFHEGEYEDSLQSHHRALELTLKIFDRNHGNAAAIYHELGVVLRTLKNYSQALEYQQQALDAHISSDANSSKASNSYHELGVTQCYIGEYSAALESHQRALHIRLKNHGDHHRDTGRSYYELGITQWYLEKYEDALSSHKEANRISIEVLGKQNRETADSYHELGKTYFCLKKYREASRSHQHALRIRQKLLGDEHVDTANSYYELGISHLKLNQYDLAHKNLQRAFNIRQGQARDEEIARSYHYLGRVQYKEVEYSQAIESHKNAVLLRKRLFGENHPETAESYYEWGKTSFHEEDLAKALALLERSLAISESEMGKDHEKTGDHLYQLGLVQWKIHRLEESLSTHQRALDIRLKHLGRYHNKTAKSLYQIGLIYNSLGRFNRAANSHVQARRIRNETLGNLHTETARSYLEEGASHFKRGDYHSAQEALQFAVKITTELLTNDILELVVLPHDMRVKNLLRIDHESGLRFYQRVSRMHQKRLAHLQSNNHSLEGELQGFKNTLANIASIYNEVGKEEYLTVSAKDSTRALNLFKRALDIGLQLFGITTQLLPLAILTLDA